MGNPNSLMKGWNARLGYKMQDWSSRSTAKVQSLANLMQAGEVICLLKKEAGDCWLRLGRHPSGKGEKSKFLLARAEFGGRVLDRARPKGMGPNSNFLFPSV